MIIKVCGLREPDNIRAVEALRVGERGSGTALGVDWLGLIFWPKSPRCVTMIPTHAGIIPDRGAPLGQSKAKRVGVFVDEMPQNIITCAVNYRLDLIQLHGHESPTLIRNLRRTLDPDLRPGIQFIKAISVSTRADIALTEPYAGLVDYFLFDTRAPVAPAVSSATAPADSPTGSVLPGGTGLQFDWTVLADYVGETPFLLSGGIGPGDAERVLAFHHPRCVGIDLNSRFELAPGLKDINKLKQFLEHL